MGKGILWSLDWKIELFELINRYNTGKNNITIGLEIQNDTS